MAKKTALIVGASGIVGRNLATHLATQVNRWSVYGLARKPAAIDGVQSISADLLKPELLRQALATLEPTHIFLATWMRQPTEAENIRVNSAMVRNLLEALSPAGSVEHVALVTGLKHYLGPFEAYGKGALPPTPFREEQPRLDVENFYYAQEDEVFSAANRDGFGWSVHRPHTIIGYAVGNAMNMGVTLAVYAAICRETGMPFTFPGSAVQWNSLTDMTDARLLARHLSWASTTSARTRSGLQHCERRCLSLELDVATHGRMVRASACPLHRRRRSSGKTTCRRRTSLGANSREVQAGGGRAHNVDFAMAH
jgi:nucleoside-diphosphate-sugar epimerase